MSCLRSSAPPTDGGLGRLISCSVDALRPYPALDRLKITPSASELSAAMGDYAMKEILTVTRDGYILAGHPRWCVARRGGETTLPCHELDLTEEEGLLWIIQKHQRSSSINDFSRIRLALELEPWLKARARSNQQLGGQMKASSNLTEADKLDVRSMIAGAAGVSTGNVNKVRHLVSGAHPDVLEALSTGEVSIHQAWGWPAERQLDSLRNYRNYRGITRTVNSVLRAQRGIPSAKDGRLDVQRIVAAVQAMASEQTEEILVVEVKTAGKVLLLSTELSQALISQEELGL